MKKITIILGMFLVIAAQCQTITVPTNKTKVDSVLFELTYNSVIDGTFSNPIITNGNTSYDVLISSWNPDETELDLILDNGGSVSDCQLVLKIPQALIEALVSGTTLPDTFIMGNAGLETRRYNYWFQSNVNYLYGTDCYFLTLNHTGHILTGSEIKEILNISGQVVLMGQSDAEYITAKASGTLF